jgi:hypothetical protein
MWEASVMLDCRHVSQHASEVSRGVIVPESGKDGNFVSSGKTLGDELVPNPRAFLSVNAADHFRFCVRRRMTESRIQLTNFFLSC